jgi:DNA-binding CsgD family transcriptional regulator
MLSEHENGKTIKQLAIEYGLTVPTVKYRLYIMRKKVMN